jgi:hypothetical protein
VCPRLCVQSKVVPKSSRCYTEPSWYVHLEPRIQAVWLVGLWYGAVHHLHLKMLCFLLRLSPALSRILRPALLAIVIISRMCSRWWAAIRLWPGGNKLQNVQNTELPSKGACLARQMRHRPKELRCRELQSCKSGLATPGQSGMLIRILIRVASQGCHPGPVYRRQTWSRDPSFGGMGGTALALLRFS